MLASTATPWSLIAALIRNSWTSPGSIADLGFRGDVVHSRTIGNADLGTPTAEAQVNSWSLNADFDKRDIVTVDRPGAANRGFQWQLQQDGGAAIPSVGIVTTYFDIDWPDTKPTKRVPRRSRMAIMNQMRVLS